MPGEATGEPLDDLNPHSREVVLGRAEAAVAQARPTDRFQFERLGYFALDKESAPDSRLVFNRTITLKDTWAK